MPKLPVNLLKARFSFCHFSVSGLLFLILILWNCTQVLYAQTPKDYRLQKSMTTEDSLKLQRKSWRSLVKPTEKFDIIINRGFEIFKPVVMDSVAVDTAGTLQWTEQKAGLKHGASGTLFFGLSFNILLSKRIAFRLQPGLSFYSAVFEDPAVNKNIEDYYLITDIQRVSYNATYLEMPVGFSYTLYRDPVKNKLISYIEAGFHTGIRINTSLDVDLRQFAGTPKVKMTFPEVSEIPLFRYGVYARITYRIVSIWGLYRLSSFLDTSKSSQNLPTLKNLEIGFSIVL